MRSLPVLAATMFSVVQATQIMHRPAEYMKQANAHIIATPTTPPVNVTNNGTGPIQLVERYDLTSSLAPRSGGKVSMGYFTNWGIYSPGRNFQPTDIITSTLSHILYSFADVDPNSGTISLTDSYADAQKHYPGDSWSEPGNNLYGCLKQMYLLKLQKRNLKVLLSVGGWTYSQDGHFSFVTNPTYRATFVSSAVSMIQNYGFDGIDIDFEYPANSAQGEGFAALYTELRAAFNNLASSNGDTVPYQLTVAVSAGWANYQNLDMPTMDQALNYWNLMAYDYAGSWSTVSDDQANLYGGTISNVSTDKAFKDYKARGASASKITMGMPLYGRAFEQTAGIRQPFNGIGPGTWEAGVYDYKALPFAGASVLTDGNNVAQYSYDPTKQELVSYDTPSVVTTKVGYINSNGMAGSMFWSLDSDKLGADSLVGTSASLLGTLDQTPNHIHYPNSEWDNIKNNMGGGSGSSSSPSSPTSTSTTTSSAPTGTPGSGSCAGVPAWASTTVFTGGQQATYGGHLWTAKWWTQGDTPGGSAGVWTDNGPC